MDRDDFQFCEASIINGDWMYPASLLATGGSTDHRYCFLDAWKQLNTLRWLACAWLLTSDAGSFKTEILGTFPYFT